mgnify:CR=1 FL=1
MQLHTFDRYLVTNTETNALNSFNDLEELKDFIFEQMENKYTYEECNSMIIDSIHDITPNDNADVITQWLDKLEMKLSRITEL